MAQHTPCCCLAPSDVIGIVIGRGGATIKQISRDSGAAIDVSGDGDTPEALSDRVITIRGDGRQQGAACREVVRILHRSQEVPQGGRGIFVMVIPSSSVSFVVGSEGATISALAQESGCDVTISRSSIVDTQLVPVSIVGTLDQTVDAVGRLGTLLQQLSENGDLNAEDMEFWQPRERGRAQRGAPGSASERSVGSRSTTPTRSATSAIGSRGTGGTTAASSRSLTPGSRCLDSAIRHAVGIQGGESDPSRTLPPPPVAGPAAAADGFQELDAGSRPPGPVAVPPVQGFRSGLACPGPSANEAALVRTLLLGPHPDQAQLQLVLPAAFVQHVLISQGHAQTIAARSGSRLEFGTEVSPPRMILVKVIGKMLGNSMAVLYIQELLMNDTRGGHTQ